MDGVLVGLLCLGIALSAPVIGGALQNGVYEVRSTVKARS